MLTMKIEAGSILGARVAGHGDAAAYLRELDELRETIPDGAKVYDLPAGRGRVVEIPLSGEVGAGLWAVVTDHQWRQLHAMGVQGAWFLNYNGDRKPYVRATVAGKLTTLARVLTGAGNREVVSYRNEDPLDLRTENLEVRRIKRRKGQPEESPANTRGRVVDPLNGAR